MASNLATQRTDSDDSATVLVPTTEWIRQWGTGNVEPTQDTTADDVLRTKLSNNTSASPSVINNSRIAIHEGGTATITNSLLPATNLQSDSIIYVLQQLPGNGIAMEKNGSALINGDVFTQADLDAGNIIYTHDGSENHLGGFFYLTATDGSSSNDINLQVVVNPANDAPTDINLSSNSAGFDLDLVGSRSPHGVVVGILTTVDSDYNDTHTYTLTDDAGERFAIDGDRLIIPDGAAIEYNDGTSYAIRVRSEDSGSPNLSFEKDFKVTADVGTPRDEWFQHLGEKSIDFNTDIDRQNNIYLLGYTSTATFDPVDSWNFVGEFVLVKYDSAATKLSSQTLEFSNYSGLREFEVDNQGNLYIVATSSNAEGISYQQNTFLIKYDSIGNREWQQEIEIDNLGHLFKAATDSQDNVYIAGIGGRDTFISKYDSSGNLQWTQELAGANALDLRVDGIGSAYLTAGATLVKYDSSGNLEWKQDLPGKQSQYYNTVAPVSTGVVVDSAGNVYVSANITDDFGSRLPGAPEIPSQAMLVKYDSNGNEEWEKVWKGWIGGVEIDGEGNLYLPQGGAINKFDPNGNLLWENHLKSPLSSSPSYSDWDFEVGRDGRSYLIGSSPYPNSVPEHLWMAKLDLNAGEKAIASNGLTLNEGTRATISSNEFQFPEAESPELVYTITALPSHGSLLLNNTEVALSGSFSQADINGGNLTYTHDDSETIRDHFSFTLAGATADYSLGVERVNTGFPITIEPVNDAPTDITSSNNAIIENSKAGKVIGTLSTTDSDSDTHTYALVDDAEGRFVIEGNQLKVADSSKLDFEAATSHAITVRSTDNGEPAQSFSKELVIELTDVEDNTVKSTTNHRLGATKENLNLIGKDAINGIGNNLDNRIGGNNAKNRIRGKEGNDVLIGRSGNDVLKGEDGKDNLNGGKGNDMLDGGKGRDTMTGGAGNDTFVVDNVKDVVTESVKGGKDLLKSSVSYSLPDQVENLTLTGKKAINGTGNNAKNRIDGNSAKNRLNGKGGNDVLTGGGGNDTLIGGGGGDRLIGNQGNDLLDGGVGNDTLTGGRGSDRFIFNTGKSYRQASPGRDVIRDFKNRDNDRIILDQTTFGALDSKAGRGFSVIAEFDVVNRDAAVGSSDAIIVYNENNGKLFYNANGSKSGLGAGGVFAVLDDSPQLEANDFVIRA